MYDKVKYIRSFHKFQKSYYGYIRGCQLVPTGQIKKMIFQTLPKV